MIETLRLRLRPGCEDHCSAFARMHADHEVMSDQSGPFDRADSDAKSAGRTAKQDRSSNQPGKLTDNAFLELFNGKCRVESLNANCILNRAAIRLNISDCREHLIVASRFPVDCGQRVSWLHDLPRDCPRPSSYPALPAGRTQTGPRAPSTTNWRPNMSGQSGPMAAEQLISFRPPTAIQREFHKRGVWHIQGIEDGIGPVNLDNYCVKILELPSLKGLDFLRGLLRYLRLNINRFVDPGRARFSPYSAADAARWNSDNPVGAVLHIDLAGTGAFNLEDGSVLCSSYSDTHWIFSTVYTMADQYHPVSGNRQFGCYMISGPSIGLLFSTSS